MTEKNVNEAICCLCGGDIPTEPFFDGRNPWPLIDDDDSSCCAACDKFVVLPARKRLFAEQH
jgi:hypothetical protein